MYQKLFNIVVILAIGALLILQLQPKAQAKKDFDQYWWIDGNHLYIGDASTYLELQLDTGQSYIAGTNFGTVGSGGSGTMNQFYISGRTGKIGSFYPNEGDTYMEFGAESHEINVHGDLFWSNQYCPDGSC